MSSFGQQGIEQCFLARPQLLAAATAVEGALTGFKFLPIQNGEVAQAIRDGGVMGNRLVVRADGPSVSLV